MTQSFEELNEVQQAFFCYIIRLRNKFIFKLIIITINLPPYSLFWVKPIERPMEKAYSLSNTVVNISLGPLGKMAL